MEKSDAFPHRKLYPCSYDLHPCLMFHPIRFTLNLEMGKENGLSFVHLCLTEPRHNLDTPAQTDFTGPHDQISHGILILNTSPASFQRRLMLSHSKQLTVVSGPVLSGLRFVMVIFMRSFVVLASCSSVLIYWFVGWGS